MKKISALVFIATMSLSVFVVGNSIYESFFAPTKRVVTMYTVKPGDTWYGICDKHYMEENTECFDEFWHKVMQELLKKMQCSKLAKEAWSEYNAGADERLKQRFETAMRFMKGVGEKNV